ncbi:aldo/keto reductase [Ferviditalea candida]|uniref:Aldo/keto reductase n=1 Tax=Ferviditalea candida TaxID=3108399 RepID=A0ABU5ZF41_9BACL|nr:aldo/keto reductase [Paenibacillaceae bacterium T2]
MEYAQFSNGIKVSRIGLGTWAIGGWLWGGTNEQDAIAAVQKALDMGISLIDLAAVYGYGLSEEIIAKALDTRERRDKAILATKAGVVWNSGGQVWRDASAKSIRREIDDSLKRLKTDYVDIYQLHWPDPKVPIQEPAETFAALLKEGKIRAIGVSNFNVEQMKEWMHYAPLHSVQPPYNLFERESEEEVLPFAEKHNISVLAYGSLCRGLLTGKFNEKSEFPEGDIRQSMDPKFHKQNLKNYLAAVGQLKAMAEEKGRSVSQLAVRWVLDQPGVTTALWGARRPDQLLEAAGVSGWKLNRKDMERIERIIDGNIPSPLGTSFMAPPSEVPAG